jgi:Ca2+-binding EF-hand superfamily protein
VFAEFDEDKNGFIDKGELKMVAASLGVDLNVAELTNMVADIDLNLDGKISPEEFQLWWLSGRKGCSGSMS